MARKLGVTITPITATGNIPSGPAQVRAIRQALAGLGADGERLMATYPPQTLRKSGYRRTRTLGRSWSNRTESHRGNPSQVIVSNFNIAPYNLWVQGETGEQRTLFRSAGWVGVEDLKDFVNGNLDSRLQNAINRSVDFG